ncbi:DNRLRE domain-containing protein [Corallococcus exercitus]|uniref:DNRLRE domain-containing protein n=1 Tax=Corallococcus exercitus TaxID=2316736 RepID=UPI0035D47540
MASTSPSTPLGTQPTLRVNGGSDAYSQVQFDVPAFQGAAARAVLWLHVLEGDAAPGLYLNVQRWDEQTATWDGRAFNIAQVRLEGRPVTAGAWFGYDVTAVVRSGEALNFGLLGYSSGNTAFASREHPDAALRPRLSIRVDASVGAPVGPSSGCAAQWTSVVMPPTDDATLASGASEPRGSEPDLVVGGSAGNQALLRFFLPQRSGPGLVRARLRLHVKAGRGPAPSLHRLPETQVDEARRTWHGSAPASALTEPGEGQATVGTWVEYDVTQRVWERNASSFALVPASQDLLRFHSRESPDVALRPQLLVTYGEDCRARGPVPALTWSRQRGGDGRDRHSDLAALPDGGFVMVGSGDIGGPGPGSEGHAVIARHAADGALLWSRTFAPSESSWVALNAVAVDDAGGIVVAGGYAGAPDLGAGPLPSVSRGLFVARLGPTGDARWSRGFRVQGYTGVTDVALDAAGNAVLLGALSLTADFGGGVLVGGPFSGSRSDYTEAFLLKLDPSGAHLWSRVFDDDAAATTASTLALEDSGHVLVGGLLGEGDMAERTWTRTPFVSRVAPDGTPLWTYRFTGLDGEVVSVARGARGAVLFGASFRGSRTLAGRRVASVQGEDVLFGALSAQGELLWVRDQPGGGSGSLFRLVSDASGGIALFGWSSEGDLGGGSLAGGNVLARFAPDGTHLWSRSLRREFGYAGSSLQAWPGGGVLLLGSIQGWYALDGDQPQYWSLGDEDLLMLRFGP